MELRILIDDDSKKVLGVYDIFFTPGNLQKVANGYSSLLDFYQAYMEIIELANLLYNNRNRAKAFKRFPSLDGEIQAKLNVLDLQKLVPDWYTSMDGKSLVGIGSIAADILHSKEDDINDTLDEMLGVKLPKQAMLILDEKKGQPKDRVVGGQALNAAPVVIGCYLSHVKHDDPDRLGKELACVTLHELLHMILPNRDRLIDTYKSHLFEEALISYLAPEGLLTERLGLSGHKSVNEIYENNVAVRPYLKDYAKMLLPIMKRFDSTKNGSVWKFIKLTDKND